MIKAVLFDIGGVLIDEPWARMGPYIANYLGTDEELTKKIVAEEIHESSFQLGQTAETEFWQKVCGRLGVDIPQEKSLWTRALGNTIRLNEDMWKLAKELKKQGLKVGLLSNTEKPAVKFALQHGFDWFKPRIFSCDVGLAKPDKKIYELAVVACECQADEILFIDDRETYVNAGREMGMKAILFENQGQVRSEVNTVVKR